MDTDRIVWQPTQDHLTNSNIAKFMQKLGISDYKEFQKKSVEDVGWFWDAVVKDLDLNWDVPYTNVLDNSKGLAWSKWFQQ